VLCRLERMWLEAFTKNLKNKWINTDDRGWRLDLIWGDIWIGTNVNRWCIEKIILICEWECMWQEAIATNMK
jgi:hypothetical protein